LSIEIGKITQEAKELRESEARVQSRKIIIDDDDDDLGFYAVHSSTIRIPVSQNVEPKDSFIMGDEHINIVPETEAISVEILVSNPSESDDFSLGECDLFDIDDSYYEKSTSRLAHLALISPEIVEACVDDDDTDDDDDYDDDFYDCVDIEEDGGEIDLDISKIVDISLREKLVESYLLIEKINAFSLSPPIPISPIFCPSSTIPVVDLDLPLEEADVPSFSDDSMILSEYESFTFDDEPVMAEERIEKTKRSKNDQKPTRNEKKQKDTSRRDQRIQPEITAGSARHSQTQSKKEKKKSKTQITSQGAIIVKSPKIQGLALKFKDQGLNLPSVESVFIKKEEKKTPQGPNLQF
ncbi:hypothetical protein Tco_1255303, partial [Tanacetum coccineum]